ncbi:MAG TPA: hypothetical protein VE974_29675 [Thermoanaerobaculia bacterium]|nr:hypothetical protein [Thermoanaerobaculia bacterium]
MQVENDRYTLSSPEMRMALAMSFVAAVLLSAFTMVLLKRVLDVPAPLSAALGFLALSLPTFLPLRFFQARKNVHLTWQRFLVTCASGAVIAGVVRLLVDTVWP